MILALNATLYAVAFGLAVTSLRRLPASTGRVARAARITLVVVGGATIATAVALAFARLWFESALAGCGAIVVVGVCMWLGLARTTVDESEDDEDDDDGGGLFRPPPPEPTRPVGGPSDDFWSEFDNVRAGWERDRTPSAV